MTPGPRIARIAEGADVEIDDFRAPVGSIGDRRAALGAKAATNAGRRGELLGASLREPQRRRLDHQEGRNESRRVSPATLAMAVNGLLGLPLELVSESPAQAATGRLAHRAILGPSLGVSSWNF